MYPYGDEAADGEEDAEVDELALFIIIRFYRSRCHSLDAFDCVFPESVTIVESCLKVVDDWTTLCFFWRESESVEDGR